MKDEELTIPKASYMQTGTNNIIRLINGEIPLEEGEGDPFNLCDDITQTSSNNRFVDLFWFYNPTAESGEDQPEKPLELVTFTLNLNFGNLRINGFETVREAFHNQALFITKDLLTVNAAVYPTGLFNIRHLNNGELYRPVEQLFVAYNPKREPWHDELTKTVFRKNNDRVKMNLIHGDKNYFYIFEKRQYDLFNYALDFILNQGLSLVGSKK